MQGRTEYHIKSQAGDRCYEYLFKQAPRSTRATTSKLVDGSFAVGVIQQDQMTGQYILHRFASHVPGESVGIHK